MYVPNHFAWEDQAALWHAMDVDSFGVLITNGTPDQAPSVSHLPFLVEPESSRLLCHVARENSHWRSLGEGAEARCVFHGPHAYVSPTWYRQPDRAVPTWNYVAVHAVGVARAVEDHGWLTDLLSRLTARHEQAGGWTIDQLPDTMRRAMLGAIVGIEIIVTSLEGKRKLSQNRPAADQANVISELSSSHWPGDIALADEMKSLEEQNT